MRRTSTTLLLRMMTAIVVAALHVFGVAAISSDDSSMSYDAATKREMMRPWYLRSIRVGDRIRIPVSPFTLLLAWFALYFVVRTFFPKTTVYAEASHILLKDTPDGDEEKRLEEMKNAIGGSASEFRKHARKYSQCPSGKSSGGRLGYFRRGDMAPAFDQAVFDPQTTPLNTTVGPIRTQFGYHLIYVHDRKLE